MAGGVSCVFHVGPHKDSILENGLMGRWLPQEDGGWEAVPTLAVDIRKAFFVYEKLNRMRGDDPTGKQMGLYKLNESGEVEPQFYAMVMAPSALFRLAEVMTEEGEYVSVSEVDESKIDRNDPALGFMDKGARYTAIPRGDMMAAIPITEEFLDGLNDLSVKVMFGISQTEVALYIEKLLRKVDQDFPIEFLNGHQDADALRTLATMWAHLIMREYWVRMRKTLWNLSLHDASYSKREKTVMWAALYGQFSQMDPLAHDREGDLANLVAMGAVDDPAGVGEEEVAEFKKDEEGIVKLLKDMADVRVVGGSEARYALSRGDEGYHPWININELMYWADRRGIKIDPRTGFVDPNTIPSDIDRKELAMYMMEMYYWDGERGDWASRAQPICSRYYWSDYVRKMR